MSNNDPSNFDDFYWPAAHAILITVAGSLSIIGSYIIIREVGQDMKERRGKAISRMLMAVSIADVIWSLGWFISTYAMPSTVELFWGNVGTLQTCEFQGFLVGLGGGLSPCFSAMLSLFYLLLIRYTWTDQQLHKLEPYIYGLAWTLALIIAIFPIPLHLYNPSIAGVCYVAGNPLGCEFEDDATTNCIRGEKSHIIVSILTAYIWLWILMVIVNLIRMYGTVRTMENRNARYASNVTAVTSCASNASNVEHLRMPNESAAGTTPVTSDDIDGSNANNHTENNEHSNNPEAFLSDTAQQPQSLSEESARRMSHSLARTQRLLADRRKSRAVALQGIYYGVAFLSIYVPHTVQHMVKIASGKSSLQFDVFCSICLSLQGVWNCFIFIRNRKMKTWEGKFIRSLFCCLHSKPLLVDGRTTTTSSKNNPSRNSTGTQ